ncbi:MAG: aminotransferase class I/II-fold pyridoxal phosphate-dependent enzyme [Candidatus Latescibacteria bacterium]|nr:aminotransferase class I/II-fold pyridoxal phosphate-dependent enzyme [Candidatus Latescibacterota bacterium]
MDTWGLGMQPGVSRRGFLKGAMLGSLGAVALGSTPYAMARALLAGKTAADVQGYGIPKGIVRLNFNENPLGPSPKALEAVTQHLHEVNRYGGWPEELFPKLNKINGNPMTGLDSKNEEEQRKAWEQNRIFLANGSAALLRLAAMAYLFNGGELIEAEPGYGDVSGWASWMVRRKKRPITITRVPLTPDKRHDLDAMRKAITAETKLIIVTNPNNPTGTIVSREALEKFIDSVPETVTVLVDEAYIHFVKDPAYKNAADLAVTRPNVLVTRTFSKVYGMPGIRVGYAIGTQKVMENFWIYDEPQFSSLSLYAANAALDDEEHVRKSKQVVWEGREYLSRELKALNLSYTPSEANFIVVDVKDPKALVEQLAKQKVFVRNAEAMWKVTNHIRVSIGTMEENEVFINALRQALA